MAGAVGAKGGDETAARAELLHAVAADFADVNVAGASFCSDDLRFIGFAFA